jgi:hypothetical protein
MSAWSEKNLEILDPNTNDVPCCFCGKIGHSWAGYDELRQWNSLHWPRGWHYNHTSYGYGQGTHRDRFGHINPVMCPECWEARQVGPGGQLHLRLGDSGEG